MKASLAAILAVSVSLPLLAAPDEAALPGRGEEVYRTTCATGYCHGPDGALAGAPRLAARGFDAAYIRTVISAGTAGTPMTGFAATLPPADLVAVMRYVGSLNGLTDPAVFAGGGLPASAAAPRELDGSAATGRALFFDAAKSVGRCASCHEMESLGMPVAAPIANVPGSISALRALATPQVRDVVLEGERMPALLLANGSTGALFYDLTAAPPVLRTVPPGQALELAEASAWTHSAFIASYTGDELAAILDFLQAITASR